MKTLQDLGSQALDAARAAGAEAADVLVSRGVGVSMEIRQGALEQAERAEGTDLGLRVLIGKRQAVVSISDTSKASIEMMAERAVAMAKEAPEDPYCGLADPAQLSHDTDVSALELAEDGEAVTSAELEDRARRAEAAALAVDGISQVSDAGASYSSSEIRLMASNGFDAGYRRTSQGISCVAISGEGLEMERDYAFDSRIFGGDLDSPEEIGALAAERALARRGAAKPPTGAYPVLFDERISSSLIGHLLSAINGAAIVRGSSWLKDDMGQPVLPDGIDLIEEPHRVRVGGSRPFDAEGLPTVTRPLVEGGVLKRWVLDLSTARNLGLDSTANAVRGTTSPPSPGVSNLSLTQGDKSREQLAAEMGEGLLVTSMMGSSINPNTGDYSRGASGFWIRGGEIAEPVNECTIAGNLRPMLRGITPANDARPHLGRVIPSLLVEGLTVAGS